jgi:hypothetical protein
MVLVRAPSVTIKRVENHDGRRLLAVLTLAMVQPLTLISLSMSTQTQELGTKFSMGFSPLSLSLSNTQSMLHAAPAPNPPDKSQTHPPLATGEVATPDGGSVSLDGSANYQAGSPSEDAADSMSGTNEMGARLGVSTSAVSPSDGLPAPQSAVPPTLKSTEAPATTSTRFALISDQSERKLRYGIGMDLGLSGPLPDAGLLLTLRPDSWLSLQAGGGYNWLSFGVRGGITLVNPFFFPISFTCEGGHYFAGDANKAVHWFSDDVQNVAALRRLSYDYLNLLGGLEFQSRHFTFYVRAGVTWMRTTLTQFQQSVNDATQVGLEASNPQISYRGPTAKVGILIFP